MFIFWWTSAAGFEGFHICFCWGLFSAHWRWKTLEHTASASSFHCQAPNLENFRCKWLKNVVLSHMKHSAGEIMFIHPGSDPVLHSTEDGLNPFQTPDRWTFLFPLAPSLIPASQPPPILEGCSLGRVFAVISAPQAARCLVALCHSRVCGFSRWVIYAWHWAPKAPPSFPAPSCQAWPPLRYKSFSDATFDSSEQTLGFFAQKHFL